MPSGNTKPCGEYKYKGQLSQVTKLFEYEDDNPCPKECDNCMDKIKQMKALSKA